MPISDFSRPPVSTDVWTVAGKAGYVTGHLDDPNRVLVKWENETESREVSVRILAWAAVHDLPTVVNDGQRDAHDKGGVTVLDCVACFAGEPTLHAYEPKGEAGDPMTAQEFLDYIIPEVQAEAAFTAEHNETKTRADYLADLITRLERLADPADVIHD